MRFKQRLTTMGKVGVCLFIVGPLISVGTRQWLIGYLTSLKGQGLISVPDVGIYHLIITIAAIASLVSVPMMLLGRVYEAVHKPKDNGMWQ